MLKRTSTHRMCFKSLIAGLLTGVATVAVAPASAQTTTPDDYDEGDAIIVTAQRREQTLNDVPMSINSYDKKAMDQQGIRDINDIARNTPSLTVSRAAGISGRSSAISIRGLSSDVGSATTAIYIDDTPIQISNAGYYGGNPYPKIFDLDHIEVLYGPQGTLFGASAEGGAVRFITPAPNYDDMSIYGRAQASVTEHGAPSYEAGLAMGAPLTDNLAFRMSFWYQNSGGYIDQVQQGTDDVIAKDINSSDAFVYRAVVGWKPTDTLTITPSFFYQSTFSDAHDTSWEGYGSGSDYRSGVWGQEPSSDRFMLPALKVEWNMLSNIESITNVSYFHRNQADTLDYSTYFSAQRAGGDAFGYYTDKDLDNSKDFLTMKQRNFTAEQRFQSYDNALIDWTVGAYYSYTKQKFTNFTESGRTPGVLDRGNPQYEGIYSWVNWTTATERQIAGYASIDMKPMDGLTLTAALRYSHFDLGFEDISDGSRLANIRTVSTADNKEGSFTPKFGVSYKIAPDNMIYATVVKGFRSAGAQAKIVNDNCNADFASLGITDSPTSYQSDSLWSYEAGTKNALFGGRLNVGLSAYLMNWKNIQQSVSLPNCQSSFIYNLGDATSKGVEFSLDVRPVRGFSLGGNVGYVNMTYDDNVFGGSGILLKVKGQHIGGPAWTGHLYASYETPVSDTTRLYARGDYSFASHQFLTDPDPQSYSYDGNLVPPGATNFVSARLGARFDNLDISLFVDNLFNSTDPISRDHDSTSAWLYYNVTYRPRTIGLTLSFSR